MQWKIRWAFFFMIALIQCKSISTANRQKGCKIGEFVLKNAVCDLPNSNQTDSIKGRIITPHIEMLFQYGSQLPRGPQDTREYVEQSFKAYHYRKFFDYIHLDRKVQKLFRDSVELEKITYIVPGQDPECSACNVQMMLKFRKNSIPFGIYITPELRNELDRTQVSLHQINGISVKIFSNEEEKGAWLQPVGADKKAKTMLLHLDKGQPADLLQYIEKHVYYLKP